MKNFFKKISNPVYLQVLFWIIHLFFEINRRAYFHHIHDSSDLSQISYFLSIAEVLFYAFVINFNIFVLIPKLFYKKHYFLYALSTIFLVFGGAIILGRLEVLYEINSINNAPEYLKFLKRGVIVFKAFPLLILLFLTTIYTFGKNRDNKQKRLLQEKAETELKLLKNQINPHFLFNALNSVYTLSYIKSELTPQMILKLSEMLRYVLYECSSDKVTLEKEIIYLNNYLTFQKLKQENEKNIKIDFDNIDDTKLIAPMLFIPFIENSFKYSNIQNSDKAFIEIKISTEQNKLKFSIQNNISEIVSSSEEQSGIGLENVKRRLDLIYPDKYKLFINSSDDIYKIDLTVEL